jgi:subtilisin-like proprotein convertase family protein
MSMQAMARWGGGAKKVAPLLALLAATLAAVLMLGVAATQASAATFSNNSGITINDGSEFCENGAAATNPGRATPYPSTIPVTTFPAGSSITDVNVTVSGLSHEFPDDIGLLLVSPEGPDQKSVILMADSGGDPDNPVAGITLTFDDSASSPVPDNTALLHESTYRPNQGTPADPGDCTARFPDAPAGPYGTSLSVFNGTAPNGDWKLYVIDDTFGATGSITGWSLGINNRAPMAVDDSPTTAEDTPTNIAVLSNDTDADGDALSVSAFAATSAQGGTVSKNADGTLKYTPAANFNGTDSFTYTVSDGIGGTATATVNLTVTPVLDVPASKEACKKGHWQELGYPDQGTCITAFNENRP